MYMHRSTLVYILEVGGSRAQRPQPGNALQERRDVSIERKGLGKRPGARISVLSSSLLLFFSAPRSGSREGGPGKETWGEN